MPATLTEYPTYWELANDQDTWFIEKTGVQMSNDYGSPWAHIWAGFRGIEDKPNAEWEEFLVDVATWTWSTDSGTGWVKLIGDAYFAPGNKVHVHMEWILEDEDTLLEIRQKTTNDWKDFADVEQVCRNGQIDVNGGGPDCWYRFYEDAASIIDGQLPADVSYNSILDDLANRYKLIGNSKDIDWRWDETFDLNGTPTISDVTLNVVNTNSKYGPNGYVEHVFNIGAVEKGQYIETVSYWHDQETHYMASLNVFEMSGGTNRNYSPTGNTLDNLKWFGFAYPVNSFDTTERYLDDSDDKVAIKFTATRRVEKCSVYIKGKTGTWTLRGSIQADSGADPSGTPLSNLSGTIVSGDITTSQYNDITFTGDNLTEGNSYWLVFDFSSYSSGAVQIGVAIPAITSNITGCWLEGYKNYDTSWDASLSTDRSVCAILYGKSDGGYYNIHRYGTDAAMMNALASDYYPNIKNDETTLYRTVFQIKPLDDNWKSSKDASDEMYFHKETGGTNWDGFYATESPPDIKSFWDDGSGPTSRIYNIFVAGDDGTNTQTSEWNGTDTTVPGWPSGPSQAGMYDLADLWIMNVGTGPGTNWEDNGMGLTIAAGNWCLTEWWFKVTDVFAVDDIPEVRFYDAVAGGGGVQLMGCRFGYLIVSAGPPPTGEPTHTDYYRRRRTS